ncbi:MAG: PfkB family carbohydrate kinase [Verrucomicrobia bacterium]|nr:PfkB family carbohydrate kinase [Verrucomicrobiota bacterium]
MNTSAVLEACRSLRILVIGDVMLDHYIWGEVNRISPEAPVPVLHVMRESHTAGGAANVALNLASLGATASLIGTIGDDEAGTTLARILEATAIDFSRCNIDPAVATIVKTRVIARTQQLCRIDRETTRHGYALEARANLDAMLECAVAETDAVIVSDYAKGVVTQALMDRLIALADARGLLLAVDPKPSHHLSLRGVGLITPNRHEALELAGLPEPGPGEAYPLEAICRSIHAAFAPKLLVITLGADGMALSRAGKVEHILATAARKVFDVSGAGDTVIATLTAALASGASAVEAASLANRAAGVVVSKMGTATATPEEILSPLQPEFSA